MCDGHEQRNQWLWDSDNDSWLVRTTGSNNWRLFGSRGQQQWRVNTCRWWSDHEPVDLMIWRIEDIYCIVRQVLFIHVYAQLHVHQHVVGLMGCLPLIGYPEILGQPGNKK